MALQCMAEGSTVEQRSSGFKAKSRVWLAEQKAKLSKVWGR